MKATKTDTVQIDEILQLTRGNMTEAARMLNCHRGTVYDIVYNKREHVILVSDTGYQLMTPMRIKKGV